MTSRASQAWRHLARVVRGYVCRWKYQRLTSPRTFALGRADRHGGTMRAFAVTADADYGAPVASADLVWRAMRGELIGVVGRAGHAVPAPGDRVVVSAPAGGRVWLTVEYVSVLRAPEQRSAQYVALLSYYRSWLDRADSAARHRSAMPTSVREWR